LSFGELTTVKEFTIEGDGTFKRWDSVGKELDG
jgi:hypothetical protein